MATVRVAERPVRVIIEPGQDHGATGGARRRRAKAIGEPNPILCQAVKVRRTNDRVSIAAQRFPAVVVGNDQDDVWSLGWVLSRRHVFSLSRQANRLDLERAEIERDRTTLQGQIALFIFEHVGLHGALDR